MGLRTLTRDEILNLAPVVEQVPVPEWGEGVGVNVRAFDLDTRDAFFAAVKDTEGEARAAALESLHEARLAVFCVVDADGRPVFTPADIPALRSKSAAALARIATVARRLNGLDASAEAGVKN